MPFVKNLTCHRAFIIERIDSNLHEIILDAGRFRIHEYDPNTRICWCDPKRVKNRILIIAICSIIVLWANLRFLMIDDRSVQSVLLREFTLQCSKHHSEQFNIAKTSKQILNAFRIFHNESPHRGTNDDRKTK